MMQNAKLVGLLTLLMFAVGACGDNGVPPVDVPDAADDAQPDAGNGLADGQCRGPDDCANQLGLCLSPGTSPGCGICFDVETECADDAACSPGSSGNICAPVSCACAPAFVCSPGCTTTGCGEGEVCDDSSERCLGAPCNGDDACPSSFSCTDSTCVRTICDGDDAPCRGGYCVSGQCYEMPGTCALPPP